MRRVRIEIRKVGQMFGCFAVILDSHTKIKIWETQVRPYGLVKAIRTEAEKFINNHNWINEENS